MNSLKITVPEPCHEDWNKMTNTDKGKFCNACTKEVFDFTTYSDEQLIKKINNQDDLCGRFTSKQLNRPLVLQRKEQHNYLSYAFSGIFSLLLLNASPSKAQEKLKTIQTNKKFVSIPLQNTRVNDSISINGTIVDETDMPLPGATVQIKGATTYTSTDFDGKFNLDCKTETILIISYVGYHDYEVKADKETLKMNLKPDSSYKEAVIVTGGIYIEKQWIGSNLFTRFTNLFRENNKNPKYRH